jgi:hypothetical protein
MFVSSPPFAIGSDFDKHLLVFFVCKILWISQIVLFYGNPIE